MKKPFVLIAAFLVVVGLGAAVAVAEDTTKVRTSAAIKYQLPNHHPGSLGRFVGRVKASKGCEKQRKVSLQQGASPMDYDPTDRSNNDGRYRVFPTRRALVPGVEQFWVVVQRKIIKKDGERIVCERARSKKTHDGPGY